MVEVTWHIIGVNSPGCVRGAVCVIITVGANVMRCDVVIMVGCGHGAVCDHLLQCAPDFVAKATTT